MPDIDGSFKAFADPTRRAILRSLRSGSMNAGQIAARVGLAANAVSFHLRVLRNAALVNDRRQGQFIWYGLNRGGVDDLVRFLVENFSDGRAVVDLPNSTTDDATATVPIPGSPPWTRDDEDDQADEITLL
jgi:ArsR family transcriptional regulator